MTEGLLRDVRAQPQQLISSICAPSTRENRTELDTLGNLLLRRISPVVRRHLSLSEELR